MTASSLSTAYARNATIFKILLLRKITRFTREQYWQTTNTKSKFISLTFPNLLFPSDVRDSLVVLGHSSGLTVRFVQRELKQTICYQEILLWNQIVASHIEGLDFYLINFKFCCQQQSFLSRNNNADIKRNLDFTQQNLSLRQLDSQGGQETFTFHGYKSFTYCKHT